MIAGKGAFYGLISPIFTRIGILTSASASRIFPGCIRAGKTLDEAHRRAAEALSFHIAGMIEDGEPIPAPSSLDFVAEDPAREGALAFLVHVDPADRTVPINITAREKPVEQIDRLGSGRPDALGVHGAFSVARAASDEAGQSASAKQTRASCRTPRLGLRIQIGSDSRQSDNLEILHELFHLPSKYARFVFGDWAYLGTRHHTSLYQTVPPLGVD